VTEIKDWHAHVYFDQHSSDDAKTLREKIETQFPDTVMGRWHEKPVGPHPMWSYQILFSKVQFAEFLPWMILNRHNVSVLVHPNTGDDLLDHTDLAVWLGKQHVLNLDSFNST